MSALTRLKDLNRYYSKLLVDFTFTRQCCSRAQVCTVCTRQLLPPGWWMAPMPNLQTKRRSWHLCNRLWRTKNPTAFTKSPQKMVWNCAKCRHGTSKEPSIRFWSIRCRMTNFSPLGSGCDQLDQRCDTKMVKKPLSCWRSIPGYEEMMCNSDNQKTTGANRSLCKNSRDTKIAKGKKDFVHLPLSLRRDASRCWAKIPLVVSCRCAGSSGNCDNSRKSAMDITHMGYFLSRIVDTCPKDWILGALSALKASEMGSATTNCRQLRPMWWQTSPVPLHLIIWLCWDCEGVLLPNGHLVRIQA